MFMKILILNILKDEFLIDAFDRKVGDLFSKNPDIKETFYIKNMEEIESVDGYSHFIISGSEASVLERECWFEVLSSLIQKFVNANKPILGICFGHQFLAQFFCGKGVVRKAIQPELGWVDLTCEKNDTLFLGIESLKSFVLHYDEVVDLDDRFDVIAHSHRCSIHAFRMRDRPVWGIQFHPDFLYSDTERILGYFGECDPFFENHCVSTIVDREEYEANEIIFMNFISVSGNCS